MIPTIKDLILSEHHEGKADIAWITQNLATGGDLHFSDDIAKKQVEDLVAQGVTHIIDMRVEWSDEDRVKKWAPHIEYLHNPTNDARGHRIADSTFQAGVTFARKAFRENPDAKVLAHCHMGINRGPSMAMAILMSERQDDPWSAFLAIRAARDIAYVAYAEDAVRWRLRSLRHRSTSVTRQATLRQFQRKYKYHWSQDEIRRINGVIRGKRAQDGTTVLD